MGETGFAKPVSEDPDNTYLYRDLRKQMWKEFTDLIPVRKAGILTPDPVITAYLEYNWVLDLTNNIYSCTGMLN